MIFLFGIQPSIFAQAAIPDSISVHSLPEVAIYSPRATFTATSFAHIFHPDSLPPQSLPQLLSENTPFLSATMEQERLPPLLFGERRRSIPPSCSMASICKAL
ncbi:MAG: hypothetical protein IPL35_17090 [Sphingobacteriales bacterium]|nr:hypothetical protein [Sphingobacteriales bacterium]